jgi:death-on-curing protein
MTPLFLTQDEVLEIHADQIARYGGAEGIRDPGLLQSALAQPGGMFGGQFLHVDLFEMAAAYLFHLAQNHPFIDGNKRVGIVAALVFLEVNDVNMKIAENDMESLVLGVVRGQTDKEAIATFFRERVY